MLRVKGNLQLASNNMSKSFWAFCCGALLFVASAGATGQKHLLGGPRDIDINKDENAKDALNYAVQQHNNNTTDNYLSDVSQVLNAQSQVVQGIKYTFTVIMANTNCTKDSVNEVCAIPQKPENAQTRTCKFTVWSRPWLKSTIVNEECI